MIDRKFVVKIINQLLLIFVVHSKCIDHNTPVFFKTKRTSNKKFGHDTKWTRQLAVYRGESICSYFHDDIVYILPKGKVVI